MQVNTKFAPAINVCFAQRRPADQAREEGLRPGAVLVVGSGRSGVQIAEDLHLAGRARDGMHLYGRMIGVNGDTVLSAPDLAANLDPADEVYPRPFARP